jgi:GNAT superfamily N-acetyltransferase
MSVSPSSIRLRRATVADAAPLSSLAARLFTDTFGPANSAEDMRLYVGEAFTPQKQTGELMEPRRTVFIAENADSIAVGYASALRASRIDSVDAENPAEVERIYVDRALHGQRVGDLLMDACLAEARSWKSDVLWLAVWEENPRAIAFYEKRGFQRAGAKSFRLGTDLQRDIVMALSLA